jgi:hypothetical protein
MELSIIFLTVLILIFFPINFIIIDLKCLPIRERGFPFASENKYRCVGEEGDGKIQHLIKW